MQLPVLYLMIKQCCVFDSDYNLIEYIESDENGEILYKETIKRYDTPYGKVKITIQNPKSVLLHTEYTPIRIMVGYAEYETNMEKAFSYVKENFLEDKNVMFIP